MGLAAKEMQHEPQPVSNDVLRSLLHVINNEVRPSPGESKQEEPEKLDLEQLLEVLLLTRDAINEQIKGASQLMAQVARFSEVESAYQSERRSALQLREERDAWKERALLVTSWVKGTE